ncbi:MAG: TonB-dependent receptor [Granulosicoccus sp.]|nr:TonB-dependent receptor [Granulosicoccus sp.]
MQAGFFINRQRIATKQPHCLIVLAATRAASCLLFFISGSCGIGFVLADETEGSLDPIVVTAPVASGATGDVVHEEHPGSTDRISREQLRQSLKPLGEILASEAGIQQRQVGGFGTFSSITMRAASSAQTAVYLDGILLNSSGEAVIDLSTLETLNLDSIEIFRGTTPLQLGHGNIGGAVNLATLKNTQTTDTRLRLSAGSFDQGGMQFTGQGNEGGWDWTGSVSRQQSQNDYIFTDDHITPLDPHDVSKQRRNNGQAERAAVLLKSGYQTSSTQRTDLLLMWTDRDLGVPEWLNSADNQASYETEKLQLQISQQIDQLGSWNTRHTLYNHTNDVHYDDKLKQINLLAPQDLLYRTRTLGAKSYWERFTQAGTLGLSADYRSEILSSTDGFAPNKSYDADRQQLLTSAHLAWSNASDRWLVTPAIRWIHLDNQAENDNTAANQLKVSSTRSNLSLQLGTSWKFNNRFSVQANAGNYFREPSFSELYGSFGLINGNPDLDAEEGINLDIGLNAGGDDLKLSLGVFHSERDELIVNTFNSRGIGRTVNTGKAKVTGIEFSSDLTLMENVQLSTRATWQDPVNLNRFAGFYKKNLPGEARQAYAAKIRLKRASTSYWYEWNSSRNRFYDTANLLRAKDSSIHSLGFDWQGKSWQLSVRLHNLDNQRVEDFNGFPKPGRTWSFAVTHAL